nr:integrase, catalytic region, zinc finger, CCHC-type, peptidase aspartic, catalytic [Tanacetum cinerariifolium]
MANLLQYNLALEKSDLPTVDKSYEAHEDHKNLYDTLQKSLKRDYSNQFLLNLEEARQKKRKRRNLPRTPSGSPPLQPPPLPPLVGASGAPGTSGASGSSQFPPPPPHPPSTGTSGSAQQQGIEALSCSKHMTGDHSWLKNFVKKFIGTVRFGNDHFGAIMGYGDYVIGDIVISKLWVCGYIFCSFLVDTLSKDDLSQTSIWALDNKQMGEEFSMSSTEIALVGEIPGRHCGNEKIVRVPSRNETLIIRSNGSKDANES